jgi:pyruvate ferredoxin oxidoreductase gamma subunit
MYAVRIHGRGGQGVVTAAEMLSVAAFTEGRYAQAFPSFGSERTGAPIAAFCRIDDKPIRLREPVLNPDALIIQDPTLRHQVDLFNGLKPDGFILINSVRDIAGLGLTDLARRGFPADRTSTVPATDIARRAVGQPLPNAAMLGAFAALTGTVSLASVETAIRERFTGRVADDNVQAARDAFTFVRYQQLTDKGLAHA